MFSSYLFLVSVAQEIAKFGFILSTVFGSFLIFLTLFGVRKIFGTYKYLMVIFTSLGVVLAGLEVIFHPNLHFYNSGFVFFSLTLPFGLGKETMQIVLALYAGVYSMTISLIAVQFIYRYWALFSVHFLSYFQNWKSLIWILYCLFFGANWSYGIYFFLDMDKISEEYFKQEMLLRYNVSTNDIPMKTFLAFDPEKGFVRFWNVVYTTHITIIICCQYLTMIYCGWNMYFKMEAKLVNLSAALKHHHRQLFKTLMLQIATPTIFLFAPLTSIAFLPYFQFNISFPAGAVIMGFSLYPPMDSIIVLLVVSEYRMVIKRFWKSAMPKIRKTTNPHPLSTLPDGTTVTHSTVMSTVTTNS